MNNMLKLIDISYKVKDKTILNNINISINEEETLVITGSNGSGKSTLLKIIMGIIKPTSGKIIFNDTDITDMSVDKRANEGLTYSFQTSVTFKGITVFDLLTIANKDYPTYMEMKESLDGVGLCAREYIDREVNSSLSGGELKRIELAMAIMKKGNLIMLDEPEAGIDLWSFDALVDSIKKMKNKDDRSMIIVSHQEKILKVADKILVLNNGEVAEYGSKKDVLKKIKFNKCIKCEVNK